MFSLSSISKIFSLYDFELVDALPQITHGGSMRYIIKRKGIAKKSKQLSNLIDKEKINSLDTIEFLFQVLNFKKIVNYPDQK